MKRQLLMLAIPALLISCSDKVKNEEDLLSLNREEMPEAVLLTNPQVIIGEYHVKNNKHYLLCAICLLIIFNILNNRLIHIKLI